nr:amino acid ABC transporter permease [uncultured Desulfobulbus sp.]
MQKWREGKALAGFLYSTRGSCLRQPEPPPVCFACPMGEEGKGGGAMRIGLNERIEVETRRDCGVHQEPNPDFAHGFRFAPISRECLQQMFRYLRPRIVRDWLLYLATLAGGLWLVLRGAERLGYSWHWRQIPRYFGTLSDGVFVPGPLVKGIEVTLEITGYSLVLATVIGLVVALLRLSDSVVGRWLARIYLELIRNTPLLVQIFFLYFVMAPILDIGRTATAVLALSLFEGAYASEIFRAGITSIDRGQWEACYSLGLSKLQSYRKVILPQALRRVVPPLTSQAVSLIKDSALVSTIAVYDLTMEGRTIIAETFFSFEIWFVVAAIYLILTLSLSALATFLERSFSRIHP